MKTIRPNYIVVDAANKPLYADGYGTAKYLGGQTIDEAVGSALWLAHAKIHDDLADEDVSGSLDIGDRYRVLDRNDVIVFEDTIVARIVRRR